MVRKSSIAFTLLVAGALLLAPSLPLHAQCETLEQENARLQKENERLQAQIGALLFKQKQLQGGQPAQPGAQEPSPAQAQQAERTAKPSAHKAAGSRPGYDEALALYDEVENYLVRGEVEQAKQAVAAFDEKHAGTPAGGWTRSLNRELAVVGKPAPESWSLEKWFQGEDEVQLDGAKPTLVVFWESWCPHCRNEVPKLQGIYESFKESGLQVLGVTRLTRDATEQSVREFIEQNTVDYPMAKESGALAEYFNVKGIPAAAMVKDGTIVWRGHPTRLTEAFLESWL